jgi:fructose-1,6-bisphosphatase/inositol monophosphatase family enzyme
MISVDGIAEVEHIIRRVNDQVVVPRFRSLGAGQVSMKGPMDPVTVADQEAEQLLAEALTAFLPGSVVVGEEAVSDDPAVLDALDGDRPVWIIDPIDGTRNFVAESARFSTLVALAQGGELLASWTHAPILGLTGTALAGHGAWVNGAPVSTSAAAGRALKGMDVATSHPVWWPAHYGRAVDALREGGVEVVYYDSAGLEYLDVAAGKRTAMILTWEYCWDHAAGLLMVAEAGGHVVTMDGGRFRLAGANALPFFVTAEAEAAEALRRVLAPTIAAPGA